MTIQNRLEKLEKAANISSTNCNCPREWQTRVILPDLDKTEEQMILEQAERMKPERCEQCGKLIERRVIIVKPIEAPEIVFSDGRM